MPPAPAPPAAGPSPARTTFNFVTGDGPTGVEATWTVAHDSPLITSLAFLPWVIATPPARTSVARSAVVAAILGLESSLQLSAELV